MQKIELRFAGSCTVDPSKIMFMNVVSRHCSLISGTAYVKLPPSEQEKYVVYTLEKAIRASDECDYFSCEAVVTGNYLGKKLERARAAIEKRVH